MQEFSSRSREPNSLRGQEVVVLANMYFGERGERAKTKMDRVF